VTIVVPATIMIMIIVVVVLTVKLTIRNRWQLRDRLWTRSNNNTIVTARQQARENHIVKLSNSLVRESREE
jgi:hypothetical protein